MAAIERLLDEARESRSGALVLRGEPGIGKSALLEHAVEHAGGMRVLTALGVEAESELPFAGLHQLLWPVLDRVDALPEVQRDALHAAFGMSTDGVADRFVVSVAVLAVLTASLTTSRSCASSTTRTGSTGARRTRCSCSPLAASRPTPIAMLAATREVEEAGSSPPGCRSSCSTASRTRQAVALLDKALPGALRRDQLVQVTHGNPLALLELPRGLTEEQRAGRAPLLHDVPLSAEIKDTFLAQVRPLAGGHAALLTLAAATTARSWHRARTTTTSVPRGSLDATERAGLLDAHGGVSLPPPAGPLGRLPGRDLERRRAAHTALAATLVADRDTDRRASHGRRGGRSGRGGGGRARARPPSGAGRAAGTRPPRGRSSGRPISAPTPRRAAARAGAAGSTLVAGRVHHVQALLARTEPLLGTPLERGEAAADPARGRGPRGSPSRYYATSCSPHARSCRSIAARAPPDQARSESAGMAVR